MIVIGMGLRTRIVACGTEPNMPNAALVNFLVENVARAEEMQVGLLMCGQPWELRFV